MRPLQKTLNLTHFFLFPFSLFLVSLPVQVVMGEVMRTWVSQYPEAEAYQLLQQGSKLFQISRYREAIQVWDRSLQIYRKIKDRYGEGLSLVELGKAYHRLGEYQKAIKYYQQSLELFKQFGSEAIVLNNLGNVYLSLGEYYRAIDFFQQSIVFYKQIGDREGEGIALNNR